ncbi:translocation/assembly module TamB domain-containing protein [Ideonella sp. A 288]|uniref:translocation/assembly module TamB domain-containing protein n=1 Tax=Ideonella sp. A 288 TaxID=1962181 RepID=UPI001F3AA8C5|nr:translocation/assembly module TamB domain-containing protein [Ideonella sp. A 288]
MTDTPPPAAAPVEAAPAPPTPPRRSWLRRTALGGLALLVAVGLLLGGVAYWAWRSEPTWPWLLQQAPGLQASGVRGTLAGGDLHIDQLDWALPGNAGRLQIDGLELRGLSLRLQPRPGVWGALTVAQARARAVRYRSPAASTTPAAAPASLRMPLDLLVQSLAVATVQVDDLPPVRGLSATLELGANQGALHRVERLQAEVERVSVSGNLAVGTDAPLATMARLQLAATGGTPWQGTLQADGPLAQLAVQAALTGQIPGTTAASAPATAGKASPDAPLSLQARAQVHPWVAWPLAALQLEVQGFDLASLSDRWPTTAIDGRAAIDSKGMDLPAEAQVDLANRRPGRLDEGRLPVRSLALTATAVPNRPGHVDFKRLDLQLADAQGPAGRAGGSGQWRGGAGSDGTLGLSLQLTDLQPARLDARAAALSVSGPLTLRASGLQPPAGQPLQPQLTVTGVLDGRALDGSGTPVRLDLDADASADRVLLRRALASAGAALARLAGQADREGAAWHLSGSGQLEGFDPRPWWRGSEGSAWRRGPHRIDASLSADLRWRGAPPEARRGQPEAWLAALDGSADLTLAPSVVAGVPLSGEARLGSQGQGATLRAALLSGGNRVALDGRRDGVGQADHWQLDVKAPALDALAPLARVVAEWAPSATRWLPSAGRFEADTTVNGRWPDLRSSGRLQARDLRSAAARLASADARWSTGAGADPALSLDLTLAGLDAAGQRADRLEAQASGTLAQHQLRWRLDSPVRPPAWTENLLGPAGVGTRMDGQARGQWSTDAGGHRWQWQGLTLSGGARDARGASRAWLQAQDLAGELRLDPTGRPMSVVLEPGRLQLLGTRLGPASTTSVSAAVTPVAVPKPAGAAASGAAATGPEGVGLTALRWRQAEWKAGGANGHLLLAAELEALDVAPLLRRLQPDVGWGGDLSLAGRIDIRRNERFDAEVVLERAGGDLRITDELGAVQALGLTELRLALTAHDGLWQFAQGLAGAQIGQMAGAQVIRTQPTQVWPPAAAPLQGVVDARVDQLGAWGLWVPPGWRLAGSLHTRADVGGTVAAPELSGRMQGQDLSLRNVLQGIHLSEGVLDITLAGDRARVDRFSFKGGEGGRLDLTGDATLGANPSARLSLVADKFRVLGRIDRRVVASGQADVRLDRLALQVDGRVRLDEGLFDLSQGDAPTLDDDVQVHRRGTTIDAAGSAAPNGAPGALEERPAPAALPAPLRNAKVQLAIDLGDRLRVRGRGLDTGLKGELRVTSPGGRLALDGTVRATGGTYAAYGQKLEITRGDVIFSGAANNPRLDVLAVRPNLDVVVGVAVAGTAQQPRIRLVSEPEMAEMDKLSWLVLGRSPDGLGRTDTALLQRAAIALLAGEGKAPTDELLGRLGLTDFSVRQTEGDVRETIVTLGKQLSRRWYVGYERGLNATTGTWQLIYRIAQRFTLRAQSGEETSLDLIWSWRWN